MHPALLIVLLTLLAGLAMPAGALLARIEHIRPEWLEREFRHTVIAFGGGVLLSAVALVLVPDGARHVPLLAVVPLFLAGGLAFLGLDRLLARTNSPASQLVAMLADFAPEALALGTAFATGESTGVLLALLITLQNLPEGFNAYRELVASGRVRPWHVIVVLFCLSPVGMLCALAGYYWLADAHGLVASVMLFAAGGILYLTFQDIAPQARLKNHHAPAFGAVLGFACGLIGQLVLTHVNQSA